MGCRLQGPTLIRVVAGGIYAAGPALTCPSSRAYWVRAVVKVAVYRGNGHWAYITPTRPSTAIRDRTGTQRSVVVACPAGRTVRAVASFVLTWPDGRQVRYRHVGGSARC